MTATATIIDFAAFRAKAHAASKIAARGGTVKLDYAALDYAATVWPDSHYNWVSLNGPREAKEN